MLEEKGKVWSFPSAEVQSDSDQAGESYGLSPKSYGLSLTGPRWCCQRGLGFFLWDLEQFSIEVSWKNPGILPWWRTELGSIAPSGSLCIHDVWEGRFLPGPTSSCEGQKPRTLTLFGGAGPLGPLYPNAPDLIFPPSSQGRRAHVCTLNCSAMSDSLLLYGL